MLKKINYVGIISAVLMFVSLFIPYATILGADMKICGTDFTPLLQQGLPSNQQLIFNQVHYAFFVVILVLSIVLLAFSIKPISFFNILFIVCGVLLSIIFVLLDIIIIILFVGAKNSQLSTLDIQLKYSIFVMTLGFILMLAAGIVGQSKVKQNV